jgi:lysophospholipase L1-like esterase
LRITAARLLAIAVLALLGLEVGLRLLTDRDSRWNMRLGVLKRYDPVTYFRLKSNYRVGDGVYTNEQGYLARPGLPHEAPADARRLIYLGDSVTVLPVPGFYPAQAEQLLQASGLRVETLNAAVPGYSTENARALFESDLQQYDGHYFFVALGWNDLGQFGPEGLGYKRKQVGYRINAFQKLLTNVYSLRLIYAAQDYFRRSEPSVDVPLSPADEKLYADYQPAHYDQNLRAILQLAKRRYPNVLIMNLATITNAHPTEHELATAHYPAGMDKNMRKLDLLVRKYNDVVATVAAAEGVEMLDLHALFDSEAARLEFTDACHLNRAGAARIARVVADAVLRRDGRAPPVPETAAAP